MTKRIFVEQLDTILEGTTYSFEKLLKEDLSTLLSTTSNNLRARIVAIYRPIRNNTAKDQPYPYNSFENTLKQYNKFAQAFFYLLNTLPNIDNPEQERINIELGVSRRLELGRITRIDIEIIEIIKYFIVYSLKRVVSERGFGNPNQYLLIRDPAHFTV